MIDDASLIVSEKLITNAVNAGASTVDVEVEAATMTICASPSATTPPDGSDAGIQRRKPHRAGVGHFVDHIAIAWVGRLPDASTSGPCRTFPKLSPQVSSAHSGRRR